MLSKNFYECDEVCYALLDSLRYGRSKEAVYWAYELQISHEYELLDKTMIRAWLLFLGAKNIHVLDAWFANEDAEYRLRLIMEFDCGKRRKVPMMLKTFYIAGRGFSTVADHDKVNAGIESNNPFSVYMWLGPGYEKAPSALLEVIAGFVDSGDLFDGMRKAMAASASLQLKILLGAAAVQLLCLSSYPDSYELRAESATVCDYIREWDGYTTKARRIYPILERFVPHGGGRLTQSVGLNIGWRDILGQRGSAFWKAQLSRITDDVSQERVLAELFPDDIPDEWGLGAKCVSHPVKSDKYFITMKNSYRMKLIWGHAPVLRRSWDVRLKGLLKACFAPDK